MPVLKPGFHNAGNLEYSYTDPSRQDGSPSQVEVYLSNNVGTYLQLGRLRQMGVNEIDQTSKSNHVRYNHESSTRGDETERCAVMQVILVLCMSTQ